MPWCVDRFEGDIVVCERWDGSHCRFLRSDLPPDVREGDILVFVECEGYKIDRELTEKWKNSNYAKQLALLNRKKPVNDDENAQDPK